MVLTKRAQKFLESKTQAGDYAQLRKNNATKPWWVYFVDGGKIVGVSTSNFEKENWQKRKFSYEQIKPLLEMSPANFYVKVDSLVDNLYSIHPLEAEIIHADQKTQNLQLVEQGTTGDVVLTVNPNDIKIELSDNAKKIIKNETGQWSSHNNNATFYITSTPDPHMFVGQFSINFSDALDEGIVVDVVLGSNQLFVKPVFDKYVRK